MAGWRREPAWVGTFGGFEIVVAEGACDVGVVFGVAISVVVLAERVVSSLGYGEDVGEV